MAEASVQPEASVASTGLGLNYIGEHCYAYPVETVQTAAVLTVLDFTTGSGYIVGELFVSGPIAPGASGGGGNTSYQLKLNDIDTLNLKVETEQEDQPSDTRAPILLPPFTKVELTVASTGANVDRFTTASFVGRVYGVK
jgi:hypothetical protein